MDILPKVFVAITAIRGLYLEVQANKHRSATLCERVARLEPPLQRNTLPLSRHSGPGLAKRDASALSSKRQMLQALLLTVEQCQDLVKAHIGAGWLKAILMAQNHA